MPFSAFDVLAHGFSGAASGPGIEHPASQNQGALAALDDDDVDHSIVLFGVAVAVPIEHPEPVVTVIGERFAGGMVRADLPRKRLLPLFQFGRFPQGEPRVGGEQGRGEKSSGE